MLMTSRAYVLKVINWRTMDLIVKVGKESQILSYCTANYFVCTIVLIIRKCIQPKYYTNFVKNRNVFNILDDTEGTSPIITAISGAVFAAAVVITVTIVCVVRKRVRQRYSI